MLLYQEGKCMVMECVPFSPDLLLVRMTEETGKYMEVDCVLFSPDLVLVRCRLIAHGEGGGGDKALLKENSETVRTRTVKSRAKASFSLISILTHIVRRDFSLALAAHSTGIFIEERKIILVGTLQMRGVSIPQKVANGWTPGMVLLQECNAILAGGLMQIETL